MHSRGNSRCQSAGARSARVHAARPVIGEGLEAMVWTILLSRAREFDPALLNAANPTAALNAQAEKEREFYVRTGRMK